MTEVIVTTKHGSKLVLGPPQYRKGQLVGYRCKHPSGFTTFIILDDLKPNQTIEADIYNSINNIQENADTQQKEAPMPKQAKQDQVEFSLISIGDTDNRVALKSTDIHEAALEALTHLGYGIAKAEMSDAEVATTTPVKTQEEAVPAPVVTKPKRKRRTQAQMAAARGEAVTPVKETKEVPEEAYCPLKNGTPPKTSKSPDLVTKPKRTRRTKAQMVAARAAGVA